MTLKRSHEAMEGNIKQNLSVRESAVSAPMEGNCCPVHHTAYFYFICKGGFRHKINLELNVLKLN